ncbi:MAG: hypothetical protein K0Q72_1689, partial [Armatimonadetes bacterium]|nr:hypothetical protein [Armatimonadota bacterium]
PPGVRARTVNQALAGRPAILPLSMFDRSTLIAATGKVTTFSMRDGQKVITFSWKDVAAGKGHVVLHRTNTPDGSLGLKVSIRTGSPTHDPDRTAGPTSDLIHRGDVQRTRSAATQLASRSGGNTNGGAPASRPNHQSGDRRIAIIHNRKLEKNALPLDDVLKQLAEQGNLAVLARWPRDFAPARQRLPAALADVSVEEATRRIEGYYHLRATAKEQVIRFTVASRGSALDR